MTASIEIGGYDSNYVGSDIHTLTAYNGQWWTAVGNTIEFEGQQVDSYSGMPSDSQIASGGFKSVVFDTGTSYMNLPYDAVENMK